MEDALVLLVVLVLQTITNLSLHALPSCHEGPLTALISVCSVPSVIGMLQYIILFFWYDLQMMLLLVMILVCFVN